MIFLEFHPLASIFRLLEGKEFAALVEDIRMHGLREPITVFEDMVLDGRNRYRACLEAGIEPTFTPYLDDDQGVDPRTYRMARDIVLLANRTDLSKTDRATVHRALSQLNESKQAKAPYALADPKATQVGGRGGRKGKTEHRQTARSRGAVPIVATAGKQLPNFETPPLNHADRKSLLQTLREA